TAYGFKVGDIVSWGKMNKAEVMAEKFYGYLIKARMKNWPALKTMSIYARKLLGIDLDEEDLVAADAEKLNKPKHFYSWKTAEWAELFGLKEYEYAGLKRKDKERMMQHRDPRTSENAVLQAIFGRDPIPDGFYDESSGRGRNNVNGTPNADWFFGAKGRDADKAALEFKRFRGQHPLLYNMLFPKPGRAVQNLSLLKSLAAKNKNSRQQIKKSLKTLSALIGSSQQNGVLEEISLNETDGIVDLNGFYMYERVSEGAYDIFSSLQSAHAIEPVDNNLHGNFGRLVVSEESLHAVREAIKRMERYEHEDDLDRRDYDGDLSEEDQGHDNGADTPCTRILRNYERYITAKLENQDMFSKFYRNETRLFLAAVRQFATLTKNLSFEEKDWCFYMNKFLSEIIKDNKISDNIRALAVTINVLEDAISTVDLMEERSGVLPEISASVANGGEMDTKGIAHPAIDKKTAVRNDIKVEAGKTIFLVGPNASGKTVLLKSIISAAAGMSSGTPVVADKISGSAFKHVLLLSPESFFKWEETKKPDPFEIFLARTRYAIENADKDTIVIIDELGVGCDDALIAPFYCAAIEAIAATGAALVVASHREDLLSTISGRVNNVSVYESVTDENGIPTYKFKETQIVTDMGKHGLAAAKKMGWKLMAYLSVNPVEMLRKMYEFCGSGKISEGDLAENMEIMGFENDLGVLKAAMRFLVSAGIVTKDNEGYAIADYIIGDKDEASENIGLIYDMETPGGEPISESELDAKDARYFKEKTALMFSQKDISNILGEGPHDTKILKVWSGYASTDRDRKMLQLIRAYGKENGYEINFGNITENDESIKEMVDFAISGEGRSGLAVTIIPLDHPYVREHLAALKSSRVIFMDIERKGFSEESFTQLIGIVGAGIAYLQDKDNVFRHLYRILTGKDTNITLEELRKDPAKIVFMIKPAEIYDPEQLADLYRNAEMFLTKA
ncbi:MAG TPA: hypothetical protein PKG81_05625, partial [Candidatus Omnitrophota bacterium]|nr:hypothetical protein [Candidatus Omnitrophota bacterium]